MKESYHTLPRACFGWEKGEEREERWKGREKEEKRGERRGVEGSGGEENREGEELGVVKYLGCGPYLPGISIALACGWIPYFFHSRYIVLPCFGAGKAGLTQSTPKKHLVPGSVSV